MIFYMIFERNMFYRGKGYLFVAKQYGADFFSLNVDLQFFILLNLTFCFRTMPWLISYPIFICEDYKFVFLFKTRHCIYSTNKKYYLKVSVVHYLLNIFTIIMIYHHTNKKLKNDYLQNLCVSVGIG